MELTVEFQSISPWYPPRRVIEQAQHATLVLGAGFCQGCADNPFIGFAGKLFRWAEDPLSRRSGGPLGGAIVGVPKHPVHACGPLQEKRLGKKGSSMRIIADAVFAPTALGIP